VEGIEPSRDLGKVGMAAPLTLLVNGSSLRLEGFKPARALVERFEALE
jgi:hypothetical protein